jgi:hypothetical protein
MTKGSRLLGVVGATALLCAVAGTSRAEAPTPPLFGVINKKRVFTVVTPAKGEDRSDLSLRNRLIYSPRGKPALRECGFSGYGGLTPIPIWKIADGRYYAGEKYDFAPRDDYLICLRLEDLVRKKRVECFGKDSAPVKDDRLAALARVPMLLTLRDRLPINLRYEAEFYWDYQPVREGCVRLFLLRNYEPATDVVQQTPRWRLEAYRYPGELGEGEGLETGPGLGA